MGTLFLPSLEEKRWIEINEVSRTEAQEFIDAFSAKVAQKRTLTAPKKVTSDSYQEYNLIEEIVSWDVSEIIDALVTSEVRQHRGMRAVFVDVDDNSTILVGTAVVYGANYAMVGFDDETIPGIILGLDL